MFIRKDLGTDNCAREGKSRVGQRGKSSCETDLMSALADTGDLRS